MGSKPESNSGSPGIAATLLEGFVKKDYYEQLGANYDFTKTSQ